MRNMAVLHSPAFSYPLPVLVRVLSNLLIFKGKILYYNKYKGSNYRLFQSILRKEYSLIHAWDGQEAIEKFKEHRPQIILMDINMPRMDGYEATKEIRKLSADVPIIAITAFAYASDEQRVLENGFDGYMSKPINAPLLKQQIASILQKRIIFL